MDTQLMAIVAEGRGGRIYLPPNDVHERIAHSVQPPDDVPDTDMVVNSRYMTPTGYGMTKHCHLFTNCQLAALTTFCDLVGETRAAVLEDAGGDQAYADAVVTYLVFAVDKAVDRNTSLCTWEHGRDRMRNTFGRQALPMVWDFAETNPFAGAGGDITGTVESLCEVLDVLQCNNSGTARQSDAITGIKSLTPSIVSTDPPYYDNVPYADLSDFFYVWLRRCLRPIYPDLLGTLLVPKAEELVADPFRQGGKDRARAFFEQGISRVFARMREASAMQFPTTVYYAFKQTEDEDEATEDVRVPGISTGWETFLQGLVDTGWQIEGTWPIRTELGNRMRSMSSNALASSIVLVCRPRPADARPATRREFLAALKRELPEALRLLQHGNIAPVDLAQAAIGPGMAIFSRYARILEAGGTPMRVRTALALINQTLDEVLTEQEGEFDADTRWALAWFEQFGLEAAPFGEAETLSKAKNTSVRGLEDTGILEARSGKVRLLKREELDSAWDPTSEQRLIAWDVTQHLIRALEQDGEAGAAALLARVGPCGDAARALAYRLYQLCERKSRPQEALAYNSLVIAWPQVVRLAGQSAPQVQGKLL
jgi:putative DNA methylase